MIDIGFIIALAASIVALYGVWLFNQRKDYTGARVVWGISNPMFALYFFGRIVGFWDGGLGDVAMCTYSVLMAISNYMGW
jgi:hypothetical protein